MIISATRTIIALLLLLPTSLALLGQLPGLYLGQITLWSQNGPVYGATTGGYTFNFTWRYTLPGIQSAGLGLYNFQTGPNKRLNYMAQLTNTTPSSTQVSLMTQNISEIGITYLAFSVVVVTQDNNYVQLLTFMSNTRSNGYTSSLSSSKFVFGSSTVADSSNPYMVIFYQWVQFSEITSGTYTRYMTSLTLQVTASTSQLSISVDGNGLKQGARVNIMLVARTIANSSISYHPYTAYTGSTYSTPQVFISNFGVPTSDYGQPVGGNNCLMGLKDTQLDWYQSSPTGSSSFLFIFSGASVLDISYTYAHKVVLSVACFGCPKRTFVDINNTCQSCHYDCYQCSNATHCLSCNSSVDFRQFNNSTLRCDPLPGYYESNTSVSGQCRFDCLTCSDSTYCLSCNYSVDFRQFNSSTFRCDPIPGFYESNNSVSGQCSTGCLTCLNQIYCLSCGSGLDLFSSNTSQICDTCPSQTYYQASSLSCLNCRYDCYQCSNATYCLSCSSSDFRQFNNSTFRCDPIAGYYESNTKISAECSTGCLSCSNLTFCTVCSPGFIICDWCTGEVHCIECSSLNLATHNGECICAAGTLIRGRCVEVVGGCLDFLEFSSGQTLCIDCDISQFKAAPVNGICECSNGGTILNGVCNTISGCVAASASPTGEPYCLSCNISLNLNPNPDANGLCVCKDKYQKVSNTCQEICGDGYLMNFSSTTCDDGNLVDLDGCSSTCQIETNYRCKGGSSTSPSVCTYIGSAMSISLASTRKSVGLNEGVFQILINPPLVSLNQMNFSHYVSLDCNANYTIADMKYESGILSMTIAYTGDMEGRLCNLTVSYDYSIVVSPNSSLSFTVKSDDYPLIYQISSPNRQKVILIFRILSFVALAIFVVSLPLKMAGVELMACCQMVYLSLFFYSDPTQLITSIKQLSPVTGFWSLFSKEEDLGLIKGFTDRMELSPFFLESSLIITGVLLVSALLALAIAVVIFARGRNDQPTSGNDDSYNCLANRAVKIVYHMLIFPMVAGFMLVLLLEGYLNNRRLPVTRQCFFPLWMNSLGLVFAWFMTAIVLFTQLIAPKQVLVLQQSREMKSYYPSVFMGKLILVYFLVIAGLSASFDIILYVILTLELLFFTFLLFTKVYPSIFMKLVAIACETTVLCALSLPVLMRFYTPTEEQSILMLFALQGMIVVVELMTISRVIVSYCRLCKSKDSQQSSQVHEKVAKKKPKKFKEPLMSDLNSAQRKRKYVDNRPLDLFPENRFNDKKQNRMDNDEELRAERQRMRKKIYEHKKKLNVD